MSIRRDRKKMTLSDQVEFLWYLTERCKSPSPNGETLLLLTEEDVQDLEVIRSSLALFRDCRADDYVRKQLAKIKRRAA